MQKPASRWGATLRAIYIRLPFLVAIRRSYVHWKRGILSPESGFACSRDNRLALHALAKCRLDSSVKRFASCKSAQILEWPLLSISVVTFNSTRWLDAFFASLVVQRYPLSRIDLRFVDHGSSDETVSRIESFLRTVGTGFASVSLIKQPNLGFGSGHDRAIRESSCEYCLVANVDIQFRQDSLSEVVRTALCDDECLVASWELRQAPFEHPKYYDPVTLETNWSSHACVLLRRSAYVVAGGYDPRIFMYAEDVELSYRFRSYGYILKYVPRAVVEHYTYESAGQIKPLQFAGSLIGNLFIRFRYGRASDRFAGLLLYGLRFFCYSPFPGARYGLLVKGLRSVKDLPFFLRGKGPVAASFPFRRFDYELAREGAFWQTNLLPRTDLAPLVTVITRTYQGRGVFLEQAMRSVFNQTYPAVELLVVEDGGDSQLTFVSSLSEGAPNGCRVRFLANAKLGRSAAGNAGLAAARGDFILFLDDDDLLFADHLETLTSPLLQDDSLAAAYALAFEVRTQVSCDGSGYTEESFQTAPIYHQEWDYDVLLHHNFIPIQAILFKRALYEQRGGFDSGLDLLEDWNLWLRYGYGQRFFHVSKTTSLYRTPADPEKHSERQALLHLAYEEAKTRARASLERLGFGDSW